MRDGAQVCGTPSPEVSMSSPFCPTGLPRIRILGCSGHLWTFGETEAKSHCRSVAEPGQEPSTPTSYPWGLPPILGNSAGTPYPGPSPRTQPLSQPQPDPNLMLPRAQPLPPSTWSDRDSQPGAHWTYHWGSDAKSWPLWGHLQKRVIPLPQAEGL